MDRGSGAVGARARRVEDARLLRGQGRFIDDVALPDMLWAAFVRSEHARAAIESVDLEQALGVPGVVGAFTATTLETVGLMVGGEPSYDIEMPILADGEVRFVGQAVAVVVGESPYSAEDGAQKVRVRYRPGRPLTDMKESARDEDRVHPGKSNVFYEKRFSSEGFKEAFASGDETLEMTFRMSRITALSIEPRGAVAEWDAAGLTLYLSCQSPHAVRAALCKMLSLPEHRVRVVAPDVGGAFGMKAMYYPEEAALCLLARRIGRPVKWISDRRESLLTDAHARDDLHEVRASFRLDGTIVAIADDLWADSGAYPGTPFSGAVGECALAADILTGPYKIRHMSTAIRAVMTHKNPQGAYRGVWGPIATFVQEGIVDAVAQKLGMDPVDVRRKNMIRPDDFPYETPTGLVFDPGSYLESMERALEIAGRDDFLARQKRARRLGRYLGQGIAVFVEPSAFAGSEAGDIPYESVSLKMEPSGHIVATSGLGPSGQGHETMLAQIIAGRLGVGMDDVAVLHGDTRIAPLGGGTGGSRSAVTGGGAARVAAERLAAKLQALAAHLLEADPADVVLEGGAAHVRGVPGRALPLAALAETAYRDVGSLPEGMEPGLEVLARYQPPRDTTYSNGCHVAEVEVDPQTGQILVRRYVAVTDCGNLINPALVEGQVHGGIVQGIGAAFLERLHYDEMGQLLTTTLSDYQIPAVADAPAIEVAFLHSPSENLGGVKGMGEGPLIAAPAALAGAVRDALVPFGARVFELPLTPQRVCSLIGGTS